MGNICEELLLGALIVITFSLELNPQPVGNGLDTLRPDSLVEFGVEPHIGGPHCLLGEVDHGFDGPGGTLFEGAAVHALVKVNGVLPGNDILEGRASLAACLFFGCSSTPTSSRHGTHDHKKDWR